MNNSDKAVLITGANGGIGQALCTRFSGAGYMVIATDRGSQDCSCDQYIDADLRRLAIDADYSELVMDEFRSALNSHLLAGLVNNAATQLLGHLEELAVDEFRESLDVNLVAPLVLIKGLLGELARAEGAVVNIGSIHAKLTKPGFVSYATSKSALSGLTQALAVDLGARVRVNTIQPAAVETEMLVAGFEGNIDAYNRLQQFHPLNRVALPDEIAAAALFLVGKDSAFMTGATLDIDGGIGCRLHDPD